MNANHKQTLLMLSFTAIFIGYLTVWLPGPGAGLSFLGIEMGEWFKFLGLGARRDLFYLPPITLSLMLAIWTITWTRQGWQAWLMRIIAVLISLLAFPAIEAIRFEAVSEWRPRLLLIGGVALVAVLSGLAERWTPPNWLSWLVLAIVGVVGAVFPFWVYLQVRPLVTLAVGLPVGIGPGVWLNGIGHLGVTAVSILRLQGLIKKEAE